MFADDITLNPQTFGGQNVDKVYSLFSWGGDTSTIRRVSATANTTPETLTVSHRQTKAGVVTTNQHMIRVDISLTDPILGQVVVSAWLVIRVPLGTTIVTDQVIKDQVGRLLAFEQSAGALAKILNSEP